MHADTMPIRWWHIHWANSFASSTMGKNAVEWFNFGHQQNEFEWCHSYWIKKRKKEEEDNDEDIGSRLDSSRERERDK